MIAKGVTRAQAEDAAATVGVRLYNLRDVRGGIGFTLKTDPEKSRAVIDWRDKPAQAAPYRRLSQRARTSYAEKTYGRQFYPTIPGAVCWHGHRDFLRELFRLVPGAEIRTAMATYKGREHFERTYEATRQRGGSRMGYPLTVPYDQACTCEDDDADSSAAAEGGAL